jgi:uncharacterized protein
MHFQPGIAIMKFQSYEAMTRSAELAKLYRAVILGLVLLAVAGCRRDDGLMLPQAAVTLPADGRPHRLAVIRQHHGGTLEASSFANSSADLTFLQETPDAIAVQILSPVIPGTASARFFWHRRRYAIPIRFAESDSDSFGDGFPDWARLHSAADREAFRSWFVTIAEQEASLPNDKLPPEIADCAALLRFAYREALVQHDAAWFAAQSQPERFSALVSVAQYHYPATPLHAGLFRVRPGPYLPADANNGAFAQFADAHRLMAFNTHRISRDIRSAQPGDLLFFRQLEQNSPYHSMIVAGATSDRVIYHTGPIGKRKGEIRRVAMQDLLSYPDVRWRPVPGNTNFLGVYRWNVLREGD